MLLVTTYFSAFILYCITLFYDKELKPLRKASYLFILFLVFLLLCFTKYSTDYDGYIYYFEKVKTLTNYNTDILFNLLILIFKYFSLPFELFYNFIGFLNFILLCIIVNLYFETDKDRCVFLLCYLSFTFLLKDLIQIRNALALKFFFLCIYYFFYGKKFSAFFLFLISVLIHNSMIMFVPVFFLHRRIKISFYTVLFIYIVFFYVYFGNGFNQIISSIPVLGGRLGTYLAFTSREFDSLSKFHFMRICMYLLFFYYFFRNEKDTLQKFFFLCVVYGYFIRICFIDVSLISGRLAENSYPMEAFLFVNILKKLTSRTKLVFVYILMFLYCLIFINMIFKNLDFMKTYENFVL